MKVLVFSPEFPPFTTGGLGTHLGLLSAGLAARGAAVEVVIPVVGPPDETSQFAGDGASVRRVAPSAATRAYQPLQPEYGASYADDLAAAGLAAVAPDVIHCHDWHLFDAARLAARRSGAPLILTVHLLYKALLATWGQRLPSEVARREGAACGEADLVLTVSHAMRELIARTYAVDETRLRVVHNGLAPPVAADPAVLRALRERHAPSGEKVIVFAGRVTHQKGVGALLRSALRVIAERPDVRYLLVGPEADPLPARRTAAREVQELLDAHPPLRERVARLGAVPRAELERIYQVADLAVVPSLWEPFGYAALEAMAHGVPVIATDVGGLPEIVEDGRSGRLCPVRVAPSGVHEVDEAALAEAQLALLADPEEARRLGEAGRARAASAFSVEAMVDGTLAAYRALTG